MSDTTGDNKPFPGFPGFPPAEMLDKMWDMMRLTPFGAAFPGMQPGTAQGLGSPLAAMSDMMTPLMSVEELDKRITDMRAVEQWLKLNLNMLQSATQALEVQRATLATLRAFGAFAQASMTEPAQGGATRSQEAPAASAWGAKPTDSAAQEGARERAESTGEDAGKQQGDAAGAAFDPAAWWNLLQSQFNQLASFAMAQSGAGASTGAADTPGDPSTKKGGKPEKGGSSGKRAAASPGAEKPAARRSAARKPGDKPAGSSSGSSTEK